MKTSLLLGTVFLLAFAVIGYAVLTSSQQQTPAPQIRTQVPPLGSATSSTSSSPGAPTTSGYTLAEVAQHNSGSSCWAAINGSVYDLTNWINQHPGGPEHILAICGTDGSAAFNAQHGGQSEPQAELANFYLAPLAP